MISIGRILITTLCLCFVINIHSNAQNTHMEKDFKNPPQKYGVRCWWWWLNSNVTKEAITRDLEAMKAKNFSGAMIFDAGGANQRGNAQVPDGPTYASPAWQELYLHALNEAKRLGLEMGLSIQSGWNLGGPNVTPDFAAKQLTFSETKLTGPTQYNQQLPMPSTRDDFYRDICVLAYKEKTKDHPEIEHELSASSSQPQFPFQNAIDGDTSTYWVSTGNNPNQSLSKENPEYLQFTFNTTQTISGLHVLGRQGYGPKSIEIERSTDNNDFKTVKHLTLKDGEAKTITFQPVKAKIIRVVFKDAYDRRYPDNPRNVQVAEISLLDEKENPIGSQSTKRPIRDLNLKAGYRELGGSAPDCRFLLDDYPAVPGEEDVRLDDLINITDKMSSDGTLTWQVPEGEWTVLRFGYTPTNAHVSTYSVDWNGHVIDYLSRDAFVRYWNEVVDPLLDAAGPLVGTVLKQLETDSWECGGMNWTDNFRDEFIHYRGYDPLPYLPIFAGKIVEDRTTSNRFLADFRKTLGDCVANNHYKVFAEFAHKRGLQIQPESGGPHAGPFDAIKNMGYNDIVMSEFWVPSPHRPRPENRFFVKQASSVAHIFGKQYVGAESFTSIGPHWDDVLWKSQKPSADHEFCSGLNMVFFHTFTCSPPEMGLPGQEYFAGTHINPQVTWWDYSDAFINYLNRCQYLVQQGRFVADMLYYYGDHVPNLVRLKEDDPAKVLPGFDYDVTNEDILLQLKVQNGNVVVPGGIHYRLLVLPDHKVLSLAALEKVGELLKQGATILGPKPERLVSLQGGSAAQAKFKRLANRIWGESPNDTGEKSIGQGRLIWGKKGREVLMEDDIKPDFMVKQNDEVEHFDYIHYTLDDAHLYYVCNQSEQSRDVTCTFRITGRQPKLFNVIIGESRTLNAFTQTNGQTEIPLHFAPYGSYFVVFRDKISDETVGNQNTNFMTYQPILTIKGSWQVSFDPQWGAPNKVQFNKLISWTEHPNQGIQFYSGKAVYNKSFDFDGEINSDKQYWLDLGEVKDVGIASVRLNGNNLGIVWTKPFRVEISDVLKKEDNQLEIDVINSWRNRLVGDRDLPEEKRYTQTNITIRPEWQTLDSGLLGPVKILSN